MSEESNIVMSVSFRSSSIAHSWILISASAFSLLKCHVLWSLEIFTVHTSENELKEQTPYCYHEKSFELIHPLKGSQSPPGVPGPHFESHK